MTNAEIRTGNVLPPEPTTFGEFVAQKCRELGLNQSQLAEACDIGSPYVSKLIRNRVKDPGAYNFLKILRALGVDSFDEVERFFKDPRLVELDRTLAAHFETLPTSFVEALSGINLTTKQKEQLASLLESSTAR